MADTLSLEIVTPTGVAGARTSRAVGGNVTDVTAPSVSGEFGVLPGHLPMLAALRTGIVTWHQEGQEHKAAVAYGFVEVAHDTVLILTDRFASREDVDVVQTRVRLKEVDHELDHWQGDLTDPRRKELIEEEQWLATLLELIGDPPQPMVREDTRFLVEHAEAPPLEEMIEVSQPDETLTDHKKPGSSFPEGK